MTMKTKCFFRIALPAFLALLLCGFFGSYAFAADGLTVADDVGGKADNKVAKNESSATPALQAVPYNALRAGERELIVPDGVENENYKYDGDGNLVILKNGSYTIRMAEGVDKATHRIEISTSVADLTLTLDNLNISVSDKGAIYTPYRPEYWNCTLILQGDNKLTAKYHPINFASIVANTTIKGNGSITLTATGFPPQGYNNFNNKDLTIESGDITLKNSSLMVGDSITVNGGTITIDSVDDCIYARRSFVMNGGILNLTAGNIANACIWVTGEIEGGELSINGGNATLVCNGKLGAVMTGATGNYGKDITFATDGTIDITSELCGIIVTLNSNVTISDGLVKINAFRGIYLAGDDNKSELRFDGGETEVTSTERAIDLRFSKMKDPIWGDDYFHKNYSGTKVNDREEVSDGDLTDDNGRSDKYVLVTPAWPIQYDLGNGALEPGVTNPEKYCRVDSFTLNNPVPNKSFLRFIGWTGTGLEAPTKTVTVPEKSKGPRTYTANYESLLKKVNRVEPTCTEPGNIEYWIDPADGSIYLDSEGKQSATKDQTILKALGHDWGDWVVTKDPTTTEEGIKTRTCKRNSSHVETESIPKVNPPEPKPTPNKGGGSSASKSATPAAGDSNSLLLGTLALAVIGLGTAAGAYAAGRKDRG